MPLFEKNNVKLLFVHIPKTGGTCLRKWLEQQDVKVSFYNPSPPSTLRVTPQHMPISDLKILLGKDGWQWSFAVVRNPYDRIESEYFYRLMNMKKKQLQIAVFSDWLIQSINASKTNPFHLDNHFQRQTDFIDADVEVFKLEEGLEKVACKMAAHFDIEPPNILDKENSSPRETVTWSTEARDMFNTYYANDFIQLDYKIMDSHNENMFTT